MDVYRRVQVLNGFLCFCACWIHHGVFLTVVAVMKRILLREVPAKATRVIGRLFHRFIPTARRPAALPFGLVRAFCLLLVLLACLLQTGCVPPQAGAAMQSSGIVDTMTEKAVDIVKVKYADPLGRDIADVLKKHFGGNVTAEQIDSRLSEAQLRDAAAIASEGKSQTAAADHPLDVLLVRVCTLNDKGEKINCSAVQRVRREDWPAFWRLNQGDWKYPNGAPLKKFETVAVEPFTKAEPPGGKPADGPQWPVQIVPTSVRSPLKPTAAAVWSPGAVANGCNCNCACPGCTCSSATATSSAAPVYFAPRRGGVLRCRSCG